MVDDVGYDRLTVLPYFIVFFFTTERNFWLFNHVVWWLKNENNFGEIVYDYGYKPIQIGDN